MISNPAPQPLPRLSIAALKLAISASAASCGAQTNRIRVFGPASSNVTIVDNTRGQSGIIGLAVGFQSASLDDSHQASRSGG